jgi:hypothetical protein
MVLPNERKREPMVKFHTGMPRHQPDRYIAITNEPHPSKADWWIVSLAVHDGDGPGRSITIENPDGEEMTPGGAKSRAADLAQWKGIEDVIILSGAT